MSLPPMNFKQFMHRSRVLSMYRSMLRMTKNLEPATRDETRAFVRREIEMTRRETDPHLIRYHTTQLRQTIRQIESMVSHGGTPK
ncbi:hypothetical protein H696_06324 [Fonticula alba]|uniref:LYR motif-containing protein 2 n=1 Tax=Fonticula alba TaxID=691883 RepID=A0A058YZ38_FONAL|nr:hypothetical protein H696_06324 [Fonticula alba]KCV67254.1 hypothetical protein H696_06324 [Fonticula alba]|eukprot:XP_009498341.1 hypothetical protein H696_06324 [Fonticula alba]